MSGITFGSVGDIIAAWQIALQLAQALSDSRGSAKEYRALMRELQAFDQALLQVVALWQNYEDCPALTEMGTITKDTVKEFKETLLAFRLKVDKRYGMSLAAGSSGNWAKDAAKKVGWLREREDILELRRKLQIVSDTITILVLAAMGKSNKLESAAQAVRVEFVHELLKESIKRAEEQTMQLRFMDEKLNTQAKASDMILATVKNGVTYLVQVHTIAIDMKNFLSLLHNHMLAQQATPRTIGGCWQQAPVILEDALGFVIPIPLELVNSWDMFETIIAKRFEKHPGHGKIQKGEFAIEEDSTGAELSRMTELTMCLSPGQKIDMSVIFNEMSTGNHCPGCGTKSEASSETRNQCKSCNRWCQRVVEIEEAEEIIGVPRLSDRQSEPHNAIRRPIPIIGPADFQRVKLISRQALLRNLGTQVEYELERARNEVNENPEEAQPKPAQEQLTDPSVAEIFQYTVSRSDELTDPATEEILREATLSRSMN